MCPYLYSEGSVIAYYWSEFVVPSYLEADLEKAMSELSMQSVMQNVMLRVKGPLAADSFVSYRKYLPCPPWYCPPYLVLCFLLSAAPPLLCPALLA